MIAAFACSKARHAERVSASIMPSLQSEGDLIHVTLNKAAE
jgi:hypothetical protein